MSTHRFILEPYKGVSTRHSCPNCHRQRCFSKYIDTEKQIQFPEYVGRCDHEQKCGYHFTPRDYFEQNPMQKYGLSASCARNIIRNNLLYALCRMSFMIVKPFFTLLLFYRIMFCLKCQNAHLPKIYPP